MPDRERGLTRQQFLARSAAGAVAIGATLAGCGGSSTTGASTTGSKGPANASATPGGTPKRGGTWKIGMITGGPSETISTAVAVSWADTVRVLNLFNLLMILGPDLQLKPVLATSAEANKDATLWTLQLRDGVVFHNGKPFTADDVVWTIKGWSSPQHFANPYFQGVIDFGKVRKRGKLTVEIPLLVPVAQFPTMFANYNMGVIQNGMSLKEVSRTGIGTGPYVLKSFTPGQQSVFTRNPNYWEAGKPYVDQMVVDSSFTDSTARLNALLGGQINAAPLFPFTDTAQLSKSSTVQALAHPSANNYYFCMRVDKGTFADNRVRLAMKLLADRPALINGALNGLGTVANDLLGQGTTYYASSLPQRQQDIEQAKSLLKQAGQSDLAFTLPTADAAPGLVEMATIFAAQAAEAGVKVNVKVQSLGTYYTTAGGWKSRPIGVDVVPTFPSLTFAYRDYFVPNAYTDETQWGDTRPAALKLLQQAIAETDPNRAKDLWFEVQKLQYDQGGNLIWGASDFTDAVGSEVRGIQEGPNMYLNNLNFADGWLANA